MVVFTCNNCGDSLQKPKVAKHYQFQCRNSPSLTCVDCFKDFIGDEYVAHIKCITEAERYGGKDYKAKPSANKGERKQQEWINVVQNVLTNSTNLSKEERSFLQSISRHQNIPRKKAKFLNFIKNAVGYRLNMSVVESCWAKMEGAFKDSAEKDKAEAPVTAEIKEQVRFESQETHVAENENNENICRENESEIPTNGSEKESKKRKIEVEDSGENGTSEKNGKKKKSRGEKGLNENDGDVGLENGSDLATGKEKKKSKKRKMETENTKGTNEAADVKTETTDNVVNGGAKSKKRKVEKENQEAKAKEDPKASENAGEPTQNAKFCWKSTMLEVLGDNEEVSLKKLRKKTVAKYMEHMGDGMTREKAVSRFEKKLKKVSELEAAEDKVKRV